MSQVTPPGKPEPHRVELIAGYQYAWCRCGLSDYQPFCDGSHTLAAPGTRPIVFIQERDQMVQLCGCKRTGNQPYCDGSHKQAE